MSENCAKCKADIITGDVIDSVTCVECGGVYHVKCAGIGSTKKLSRRSEYKCGGCQRTASVSSVSDSEEAGGKILKAITDMRADFKASLDKKLACMEEKMNKNLDLKFSTINEQISVLGQSFEIALDSIKAENKALSVECKALTVKYDKLSAEMRELREQVHDVQQYSRVNNLEIVGIPISNGENVYIILEAVARAIKVPWRREDISTAHRLPINRREQRHPNIIVRFISRSMRSTWLVAARDKKDLNTSHLNARFQPGPVYINEHLRDS